MNPRDKAGLDDFVLLENYTSEDAFIENLKIRHQSDIIYVRLSKYFIQSFSVILITILKTYIGPVLISVNPYKTIDIYNDNYKREYKNTHLFELPPHMLKTLNKFKTFTVL